MCVTINNFSMVFIPGCVCVLYQWRRQTLLHLFLRAQGLLLQTKYHRDGTKIIPPTTNGVIIMEDRGRVVVDWKYVGMAIDRLCFVIYVICFAFTFSFFFPR